MVGLINICHTTNTLGVSEHHSLLLLCEHLFSFATAMMPGYAPYMYAMAGRNGYRTRARDGYLTGIVT